VGGYPFSVRFFQSHPSTGGAQRLLDRSSRCSANSSYAIEIPGKSADVSDKDEVHRVPHSEADAAKEAASTMRSFLVQPRGQGTGWQFRMRTPAALVGRRNPDSAGRTFGTEIRRGLDTRDLRTASARAAVVRGRVLDLASRLAGGAAVQSGCSLTDIALQDSTYPEELDADMLPPVGVRCLSEPGGKLFQFFRREAE
jgi:hypothetical protein